MPWNNNNSSGNGGGGGPWGGGGKGGGGGPWGQGPSGGGGSGGGGGGGKPPDLEDLLKRSQDKFKQVMPGGGQSGIPSPLLFLLAVGLAALVGFYAFTFRVNPDEAGVVLRFGAFDRIHSPGLHLRWPPPIEEVRTPKVTRQNIIEVGMRTGGSVGRTLGGRGSDSQSESLMLTADENIVDIDFVVYWRIHPEEVRNYLFNIKDPSNTVREVAESVVREIVGQTPILAMLSDGRQKIEQIAQKRIQETLESYKSGIRIDQVQLQKVDPPSEVIDAFRDVQTARNDKERLQNEANKYANEVVPAARGERDRIMQQAEGYKQQTVAEATGQASRFLKVYEEYKKAPEVTRRRLYLETMERVMGGTDKIILDNKGGGQGVVPFLPLDQLQKKKEGAN